MDFRQIRTFRSVAELGSLSKAADKLRIAQNVLLVEHGRLLIRLEGAFDRERAIEVARSLR